MAKAGGRAFPLVVVIAVMFACLVPIADRPETTFNESDTPTFQSIPVNLLVAFQRPNWHPITLLKAFDSTRREIGSSPSRPSTVTLHSISLPVLLCTLLI